MRLRLTIAYDGRPFVGWQSQSRGQTVQALMEAAVAAVLKMESPVPVSGSGRTDAGVHALAQVAHCDVPDDCRMDEAAWRRALNARLPAAIRVMEVARAADNFHARFQTTGKTYRYQIWNDAVLPPLEAGLAWHMPHPMDFALLEAACILIQGRHDFSSFAANRADGKDRGRDKVRELYSAKVEHAGPLITFTFHGSGFLYKMVRLLTGSIVRVARGRVPLSWLEHLLTAPPGEKSQYVAPADGLCLISVDYAPAP